MENEGKGEAFSQESLNLVVNELSKSLQDKYYTDMDIEDIKAKIYGKVNLNMEKITNDVKDLEDDKALMTSRMYKSVLEAMANNGDKENKEVYNEAVVDYFYRTSRAYRNALTIMEQPYEDSRLENMINEQGAEFALGAYFDDGEIPEVYVQMDRDRVAQRKSQEDRIKFNQYVDEAITDLADILGNSYYRGQDPERIKKQIGSIALPRIDKVNIIGEDSDVSDTMYDPSSGLVTLSGTEEKMPEMVFAAVVKAMGRNDEVNGRESFNEDVVNHLMNKRKEMREEWGMEEVGTSAEHPTDKIDAVIDEAGESAVYSSYFLDSIRNNEDIVNRYGKQVEEVGTISIPGDVEAAVEEHGIMVEETRGIKALLEKIKEKFISAKNAIKEKFTKDEGGR